jgi:hypothetical protein
MSTRRTSRHAEAFKEGGNLIGLSTAVALSFATWNPLPLLVGLVAEAAYLLFVPDSKWFEARLSRKHDAEIELRRQQLKMQVFRILSPSMKERFTRLEETRLQITTGAPPEIADERWFLEVLRKLDFLLEKFLLFGQKEAEFRSYLRSVLESLDDERTPGTYSTGRGAEEQRRRRNRDSPKVRIDHFAPPPGDGGDAWTQRTVTGIQERYHSEMGALRESLSQEQDESTRAVLEKRLEVLERRNEFVGRMGKIVTNLNHQLHLLEDTFGLINDEIRARSPDQVLTDIESVVSQTNSMTQLLESIAPYEQMIARLSE